MYRSGYGFKDANQSNILALKMKRSFFEELLGGGVLSEDKEAQRGEVQVRVQWDPERTVRIGKVVADGSVRSIQVGIPRGWKERWVGEGIVGIEDVTHRAKELRRVLDEEEDVTNEELICRGLLPEEKVYILPGEVAKVVCITDDGAL